MRDEYRDLLLLIGFVAGGLVLLSAGALWVVNSGYCIGCGPAEPRPSNCFSVLDGYNSTLENGEAFKAPESCYGADEGIGSLEGSKDKPDGLRKTSEGLVLNSTGQKFDWKP